MFYAHSVPALENSLVLGLVHLPGGRGYSHSPISWHNFQDENGKVEQAREARCLIDESVL